jgi:hypothetical protein
MWGRKPVPEMFRRDGGGPPVFRSVGTFAVPVVLAGQIINGLCVAADNAYRRELRVKIAGPVGARVYVSSRQQMSTTDYYLDLDSVQEATGGPVPTRVLYVAASVAGCSVIVSEIV